MVSSKKALALAYADLASAVKKGGGTETPSHLKSIVSKTAPQFSGYQQHDSQEFLRCLLDSLSLSLNRIQGKPKYKELDFDGKPPEF